MRLYHYTTQQGLDAIREAGWLNPSKPCWFHPGWISLTTDTDSAGHGLHDGRIISESDAPHIAHHEVNGQLRCFDHTQCRVVLNINEGDSNLVRADECLPDNALWALDIAGWHPAALEVPLEVGRRIVQAIQSGQKKRKSATWWFYKLAIPIGQKTAFEVRGPSGSFLPLP